MKKKAEIPAFFHCGKKEALKSKDIAWHHHAGCEIIYIKRGHCLNRMKDSVLEGESGDLHVIPSGCSHEQINLEDTVTYFISFDAAEEFFSSSPRLIKTGQDKWIIHCFESICELNSSLIQDTEDLSAGFLYTLLLRLNSLENSLFTRREMPPALAESITYIDRNFMKSFSVSEIAVRAGMSRGHFSRLFMEAMKESPLKYINGLRLRLAIQLLKNQWISLEEIAEKCGFSEANYFSRIFKKTYGQSPASYRKTLMKKTPEGSFYWRKD